MKTLKVELADRSYPIYIGEKNFPKLPDMLKLFFETRNFVLLSDKNVHKIYGNQLSSACRNAGLHVEEIVVPAGEKSKSIDRFTTVMTKMLQIGVSRDWIVIALGGGVVGDLAGFAAASFMRGLPFVQIPTSLLAQVDSSVGGKTGINHPMCKNAIGAFYQPKLVWIDIAALATLPPVEVVSGMAEIIKYGIIYSRDFFHFCENHIEQLLALDGEYCAEAVYQCCAIKAKIVAQDERESGIRAILNFGHTIGHAIETVFDYQRIKHGEAVLWGMLAEAFMAVQLKLLHQKEFERIEQLLTKVPLRTSIADINIKELNTAMKRDKKALQSKLRFALPGTIGESSLVVVENEDLIAAAFAYVRNHAWHSHKSVR